jgi:glycosyltransferase involved in cell wall biosynthesis
MKVFIVTPSYNALDFLKLCLCSVADQVAQGLRVHHHVQDGGSTDGTVDYLIEYEKKVREKKLVGELQHYTFSYISKPDKGMYNAINIGWDLAGDDTDFVAWLNCDEQYLPETLGFVARQFGQYPTLDLCFCNLLMLDGDGNFICYRKSYKPYWPLISAGHLYTFSCTMFLRKRILDAGFRLDEQYRMVADEEFVVRILRAGFHAKHFKRYASVFAFTGNNLSLDPIAREEDRTLFDRAPTWVKSMKWILNKFRLGLKFLHGCYCELSALEYSIYAQDSMACRKIVHVDHPTWKYKTGK